MVPRNVPGPRVLPAIIAALNNEVLSELRLASSIDHPGESGRAREQIITRFLRRLLPSSYEVSTGFVIDAVGGISRQVDLVIHRTGYHPVLEIGGVHHFLIESVAAVIENKASIASSADLLGALENIASVKRLDRSNGGRNRVFNISGSTEVLRGDEFPHQVFGAIVTERSLSLDLFRAKTLEFMLGRDRAEWPNHYVDVHRFVAGFWGSHTHDPGGPAHTTFGAVPREYFAIVEAQPGWHPLTSLAFELCNYLRVAPVVDYSATDYLAPPEAGVPVRWWKIERANVPHARESSEHEDGRQADAGE